MTAATVERPAPVVTNREPRRARLADRITLAAKLTAACCSRLFAKYTLQNWRIPREQVDTAELLVSELVTNAVKITGITEPRPTYGEGYDRLKLIGVRLLLFEQSIVIEVWDTDPNPPVLRTQSLDAEGGRGEPN